MSQAAPPPSGLQQRLAWGFQRHQAGDPAAADDYRAVLHAAPDHPDALYLYGCLLYANGALPEALERLQAAARLAPEAARAHHALGLLLNDLGRAPEAAEAFAAAASAEPANGVYACEEGDARIAAGDVEAARRAFDRALRLDPADGRARFGLGVVAEREKDAATALARFTEAAAGRPDWLQARHNRGKALFQLGLVDEAMDEFRACAALPGGGVSVAMAAVIAPGAPSQTNAGVLALRRGWARAALPPAERPPAFRPSTRDGPIRLGYVSAFFHRPNWMKPVWALINRHDRTRFEPHLFSDSPADQPLAGRMAGASDRLHPIRGLDNAAVAEQVRAAGVDVLIDLNGYSFMPRLGLFSLRPAPLTIGWFNMYATTGIEAFDWLIGDDAVVPPAEEAFYAERIARVAGSYLTFEVTHPAPDPAPADPARPFTFGSLASAYKLTPPVVAAWAEILRRAPASRLVLRNAGLGAPAARAHLAARFAAEGVEAGRLTLLGPAPHLEFLAAYGDIDLALDPFPYNGGTTTTEAIWQGVPVLTFEGDRWASRTSASILKAAGLGDFVLPDLAAYVDRAATIAGSSEERRRLAGLRPALRAQVAASAACDVEGFTRRMEALYLSMLDGAAA